MQRSGPFSWPGIGLLNYFSRKGAKNAKVLNAFCHETFRDNKNYLLSLRSLRLCVKIFVSMFTRPRPRNDRRKEKKAWLSSEMMVMGALPGRRGLRDGKRHSRRSARKEQLKPAIEYAMALLPGFLL
jgi:hypothetical protein